MLVLGAGLLRPWILIRSLERPASELSWLKEETGNLDLEFLAKSGAGSEGAIGISYFTLAGVGTTEATFPGI